MSTSAKAKADERFTHRSAADEDRLREIDGRIQKNAADLKNSRAELANAQTEIAAAERVRDRHNNHEKLYAVLARIDKAERLIKYFEGNGEKLTQERTELESAIEERKPEQQKRRQTVAELARKHADRVKAALDQHINKAQNLLEGCAELTAQMESECKTLEMEFSPDLEGVAAAAVEISGLVEKLTLAEGRLSRFVNGYAQEAPGFEPYVVVDDDGIQLRETLVSAGSFCFGETVWLNCSEAESVNVVQRTRETANYMGRPRSDVRMERCVRVLPLARFRAAEARAAESGRSVRDELTDDKQIGRKEPAFEVRGDGTGGFRSVPAGSPPSEFIREQEHFAAQRATVGAPGWNGG